MKLIGSSRKRERALMPEKAIDVIEFARRVERLCEFILDGIEKKDGSDDIVTLQKIKEDAANIQSSIDPMSINPMSIIGLNDYVKRG